jgi:hypothetical protein
VIPLSTDEKKPPCGGFFSQPRNYFDASDAGAAAGAADASAAGAAAAGAAAGAAASSFLPQAARAAAAITAAKMRVLFMIEKNRVS